MGTKNMKVVELRDLAHSHYIRLPSEGGSTIVYRQSEMVLKFASLNEYLDDGELIDYASVRRVLKRGKDLLLRLLPHPFLHHPSLPPTPAVVDSAQQGSSRITAVRCDTFKRSAAFDLASAAAAHPRDFPSVWGLSPHVKMRVRIVSLENARAATLMFSRLLKGAAKSAALAAASGEAIGVSGSGFPWAAYVRIGLHNGGAALCPDVTSTIASCDDGSNPQWNEWLQTDLAIAHAPQAARACFTVYGRPLLGTSKASLL